MNISILPSDAPALENIQIRRTDGLARKFLFGILQKIKCGQITLIDGQDRYVFGKSSAAFPLEAVIEDERQVQSFQIQGTFVQADSAFMRLVPVTEVVR